ncbi:hypothetical protein NC796_22270 [Aliifodinibius sp. S!AR15-10]|uniref:hypothetical protein n=1 Tax=Aliifodinibius sp. S!AR15-10 TaxID=2950437 RepID=UPI002863F2A8|nr:hypothetical protein [Aliifodinibius sp. S!AR15-10]MDR8393896.1 hypothetical protein [Aliifodinibius sp. S!AR15-10]
MEEIFFKQLCDRLCIEHPGIMRGKMMSSEAISYNGKVFAFIFPQQKMVLKLGTDFNQQNANLNINVFNPFKNKGTLNGWFEIDFSNKDEWEVLAKKAFETVRSEI